MDMVFAQQGLDVLAGMFPKPWSVESLAIAIDELLPLPEKALIQAQKRIPMEFNPQYTPPLQKVLDVVKQEAAKISAEQSKERERAWDADKAAERDGARNFFSGKTSSDHGKHAIGLIIATVTGQLSERQVIDAMLQMDKAYPGVGWQSEASKMVSRIRREGRT